jgi:elongation factor P
LCKKLNAHLLNFSYFYSAKNQTINFMASTSDIKNGLCINFNHDIYTVVEFLHVKPGKGPAFVRTKLKSLTTGKVLDNTWPSGHKLDEVRVERRNFQYLYKDDMGMHFMNSETFEQVSIPENKIDNADLLREGDSVEALYNTADESVLTCELPAFVVLEVTYSEPGVKGDTATNVQKPATLETGAKINVPLFVNEGDKIKIDTRTRAYLERAK